MFSSGNQKTHTKYGSFQVGKIFWSGFVNKSQVLSLGKIKADKVKVGRGRGWGGSMFQKLLSLSIQSVTFLLNLIISELCLSGTQV